MVVKLREVRGGVKYSVVSRLVTIYTPLGQRIRNARWGDPEKWDRAQDLGGNLKLAINIAIKRLKEKRLGTVIYIVARHGWGIGYSTQKVFETKWGTDKKPFMAFSGIAGDYWRKRLNMRQIPMLL